MVAGATGIDLVALVIAADEGIMPQTREHMEICELLRVKKGLVVLTKTDLVDDPDWLEMVREDIVRVSQRHFLEGCEIVPVSAATGEGIDELEKIARTPFRRSRTEKLGRPFPACRSTVYSRCAGLGRSSPGRAFPGDSRSETP